MRNSRYRAQPKSFCQPNRRSAARRGLVARCFSFGGGASLAFFMASATLHAEPSEMRAGTAAQTTKAPQSGGTEPSATPHKVSPASPQQAAAGKKVVNALVNAIRYNRRALGEKHLAFATMAKVLLEPTYAEMTSTQRSQFIADFKALLVATSFAKGHDLFAYLDGLLFGSASQDGERLLVPATIVVHRNLKKTEIPVQWVLVQEEGAWKVADIIAMDESTCTSIREEEVTPLVREGGASKLLAVLHERAEKAVRANAKP